MNQPNELPPAKKKKARESPDRMIHHLFFQLLQVHHPKLMLPWLLCKLLIHLQQCTIPRITQHSHQAIKDSGNGCYPQVWQDHPEGGGTCLVLMLEEKIRCMNVQEEIQEQSVNSLRF